MLILRTGSVVRASSKRQRCWRVCARSLCVSSHACDAARACSKTVFPMHVRTHANCQHTCMTFAPRAPGGGEAECLQQGVGLKEGGR
jgi:hypothetical protein